MIQLGTAARLLWVGEVRFSRPNLRTGPRRKIHGNIQLIRLIGDQGRVTPNRPRTSLPAWPSSPDGELALFNLSRGAVPTGPAFVSRPAFPERRQGPRPASGAPGGPPVCRATPALPGPGPCGHAPG